MQVDMYTSDTRIEKIGWLSWMNPFSCLRQTSIPSEDEERKPLIETSMSMATKPKTMMDVEEVISENEVVEEMEKAVVRNKVVTEIEPVVEIEPLEATMTMESGMYGVDDAELTGDDGDNSEMMMAGSTAVVAMIHDRTLIVANSGDSRCVLYRDGIAYPMSYDHKPTDPHELSRIRNAGGCVIDGRVNGGVNLSRALGDYEYKQTPHLHPRQFMVTADPDIKTVELHEEDQFLILACDGIWDVLSNQQACEFVASRLNNNIPLDVIVAEMCDRCLADSTENGGEGCDNMTVTIVEFKRSRAHSCFQDLVLD